MEQEHLGALPTPPYHPPPAPPSRPRSAQTWRPSTQPPSARNWRPGSARPASASPRPTSTFDPSPFVPGAYSHGGAAVARSPHQPHPPLVAWHTPTSPRPRPMSASARSTDRTQSRLSTDARITSIAELDAEVRMAAHVIGSNGEGPNRALLDEKRRVLLSRKASEESRTAAVIACATAARDGRVVGRAERNADQIQAKREYQQATRHERLQEYRRLEAARRRLEEQRMMLEAQRVDEAAKLEPVSYTHLTLPTILLV